MAKRRFGRKGKPGSSPQVTRRQQPTRTKLSRVALSSWLLLATTISVAALASSVSFTAGAPAARRILANVTSAYVTTVEVHSSRPHDTSAFTQGLCVDAHGRIVESDGLYGHSRVRLVDINTGKSIIETKNIASHFGEGLAAIGDVLLQLTWREKIMIEYDLQLRELRRLRQPLPREGWGAAYDAHTDLLYLTDGSAVLRTLRRGNDSAYVKIGRELTVIDDALGGIPIEGLNELEVVGSELWANVYPMRHHLASNCIARIDPTTGKVKGWIDANPLMHHVSDRVRKNRLSFVFNGIAFHPAPDSHADDHLYLTGKQWDKLFDVDLVPRPDLDQSHVRHSCDLFLHHTYSRPAHASASHHHSGPDHHHRNHRSHRAAAA